MKAYFIYRDGKPFGSIVGYTTEKGAKNALVGTEDWYRELFKYDLGNGRTEVPQESIDLGLYKWHQSVNCYLFNRNIWSRKIWQKYFKEHYEIKEEEFNMEETITAWVARDKHNVLTLFEEKPNKIVEFGWWDISKHEMVIPKELFPQVKWEDKEPTKVELIIKIKN